MARGRTMQVLADMGEQLALPAAWTSGIDQLSGPPREYALDKTIGPRSETFDPVRTISAL